MLRRYWPHFVILVSLFFTGLSLYARSRRPRSENLFNHDAGYILTSKRPVFEHAFQFVNDTSSPITFLSVTKSCECTTATTDKTTVGPKGTAAITMSVNLPTVFRQNTLYCTIETDSPIYRKLRYQVDLVTLPGILMEPSILHINDAEISQSGGGNPPADSELVVTLFFGASNKPHPLQVSSPPYLSVKSTEIQPPVAVQDDVYKSQVRVLISINKDASDISKGLSYLNLDAGRGFQTSVPIAIGGDGDDLIVPASINFGIVTSLKDATDQSFVVRNSGGSVDVHSASPGVLVKEIMKTSEYTKFSVSFASLPIEKGGGTAKGIFSGGITVQLDHDKSRKLPWMVLVR